MSTAGPVDPLVVEVLRFCATAGVDKVAIAIPGRVDDETLRLLRQEPRVAAIYAAGAREASDGVLPLGDPESWRGFVSGPATPVLLGRSLLLTWAAFLAALRKARLTVVCREPGGFRKVSLGRAALWMLADATLRSVQFGGGGARFGTLYRRLRDNRLLRAAWRSVFRGRAGSPTLLTQASGASRSAFEDLVAAAEHIPPTAARGRVLLACEGLQVGGSETQVANTAVALARAGVETRLLAVYLDTVPEAGFRKNEVTEAGVPVVGLRRRYRAYRGGLEGMPLVLAEAAVRLPYFLIADAIDLFHGFREARPQVVHAWQDAMNVRAGLAALMAGVPMVVLSGRSLAPTRFAFWEPYMRPAYRALLASPRVRLLNNSAAGAASYAAWLDVPAADIAVVRNGFDFGRSAASPDAGAARARFGLPADAPVLGGMMRFSAEKRPLLWVATASEVLARVPECHFLLVGEGPLLRRVRECVDAAGIGGRVVLPGTVADAAAAFAAMDAVLATSEVEGLSNVAVEAQWAGKPVIATDVGGMSECVIPGVTGWLVADDDPVALAKRCASILRDRGARERAAQAGPGHVQSAFGTERMLRETLQAYGMTVPAAFPVDSRGGHC